MKIGIVCPYNMALGGAVQEISKETYDELTRRGHEAVIISPTPVQGKPELPNYRIIYLDRANDLKALNTVAQVSLCTKPSEIDKMFEREKFDVLQVHEPWVPLMNRQILKRAKCPVVATFHAKLPDTNMAKLITTVGRIYTKPFLKYIDRIVAVSDPAAEHVRMITDRPVQIIPNAVNLAEFTKCTNTAPLDENKKTILFIGRLDERKGVKYLLSAFKELHSKNPETRLVIGGKGVELENLKQQAKGERIEDVEFIGFVEDDYKKELMTRADLFVAPSLYGESFGVILIEALASGQVIVAGDNPGYRSVLKEYGEISLVRPQDISAFAAKMEQLLYDEDIRAAYKGWGRLYVEQFDYRKVIDQYEEIFEELTHKNDKTER